MARISNSQNKSAPANNKGKGAYAKSIAKVLGESAEIIDIIQDPTHPEFDLMRWPQRMVGDIKARPLKNFNQEVETLQYYHPLWPNWWSGYPLIGEIVLLVEAIGQAGKQGLGRTEKYYLPPVNVWDDVNHNQLPASSYDANLMVPVPSDAEYCNPSGQMTAKVDEKVPADLEPKLGRTFQVMDVKKLQPYEGDVIFEGRYGQSIRFGSANKTDAFPNYWSGGEAQDPIFILSNGHRSKKGMNYHIEDPDQDGASLWICGGNKINFNPPSSNWDSYNATFGTDPVKEIQNENYKIDGMPTARDFDDPTIDDEKIEDVLGGDEGENEEGMATSPVSESAEDLQNQSTAQSEENRIGNSEHTCGKEVSLTLSAYQDIVENTIARNGSSKWYSTGRLKSGQVGGHRSQENINPKSGVGGVGWMNKSRRYVYGTYSDGGECWTGILHWTGGSHRSLYQAMEDSKADSGKSVLHEFFGKTWKIPMQNESKGMNYGRKNKKGTGKNEGKTISITARNLTEFSKGADTKEANYSHWYNAMQGFCDSKYSVKVQVLGCKYKYKTEVAKMDQLGLKLPRWYAMAMFYSNSKPRAFTQMGEKYAWDPEKMLWAYCSGEYGGGKCGRTRCSQVDKHYPPCKDQFDRDSKYYSPLIFKTTIDRTKTKTSRIAGMSGCDDRPYCCTHEMYDAEGDHMAQLPGVYLNTMRKATQEQEDYIS